MPVLRDQPDDPTVVADQLPRVLDKEKVREVIDLLLDPTHTYYDSPALAVNQIVRLLRIPVNLEEAALLVTCPYCGRTPGNRCQRAGAEVSAHPSRMQRLLSTPAGARP